MNRYGMFLNASENTYFCVKPFEFETLDLKYPGLHKKCIFKNKTISHHWLGEQA